MFTAPETDRDPAPAWVRKGPESLAGLPPNSELSRRATRRRALHKNAQLGAVAVEEAARTDRADLAVAEETRHAQGTEVLLDETRVVAGLVEKMGAPAVARYGSARCTRACRGGLPANSR